jgi:hypothetical protein
MCKRYTTSHSTDKHTRKYRDTPDTNSLLQDRAAWHVNLGIDTLVEDIWSLFAPTLVAMLIGFLLAFFPGIHIPERSQFSRCLHLAAQLVSAAGPSLLTPRRGAIPDPYRPFALHSKYPFHDLRSRWR